MTNKLPDIQEEPDILKLKEKLQSISNPYYIAPYDSLQLYHYEVRTSPPIFNLRKFHGGLYTPLTLMGKPSPLGDGLVLNAIVNTVTQIGDYWNDGVRCEILSAFSSYQYFDNTILLSVII